MSIQKMEMLNMVGKMAQVDQIARKIILSSSVHMVNAYNEVQNNNFSILEAKNNIGAVIDYSYIRPYTSEKNLASYEDQLKALADILNIEPKVSPEYYQEAYSFNEDQAVLSRLYESIREKHQRYQNLQQRLQELQGLEEYLSYIKNLDFNLTEALNMQYIKLKFGKLSKYNMDKMKKNYENISAIVLKINTASEFDSIMVFVPKALENEVERALKSLNFEEFPINFTFAGAPRDWLMAIEKEKQTIQSEVKKIQDDLQDFKKQHETDIHKYYSRLIMEYEVEELKSYIVCTDEFFYLTGWVPVKGKQKLLHELKPFQDQLSIAFKEDKEYENIMDPPTYIENNRFFRPFESILKTYGIPSYHEIDPTPFVSISYLLLFGMMFGDIGQGLVFVLAGILLMKKLKRPNLGGVLTGLGISSMIFGYFYGSVFGLEGVIAPIFMRPINPMEDINFILIAGIVIGVGLLSVSYLYNIFNSLKRKDLENGVFGSHGLAGLLFFWILLYFALAKILGFTTLLPDLVLVTILILLLAMILFRQPLSNLITGKRPLYNESPSDYYVEESFGLFETLLSMFSNTLSFIRVGAFAITHVGLFLAFTTIANMINSPFASVLVIVLANIVIIGLEGLIVFIQGLRLEYYELFSKYYDGSGYEFNPIRIHLTERRSTQ